MNADVACWRWLCAIPVPGWLARWDLQIVPPRGGAPTPAAAPPYREAAHLCCLRYGHVRRAVSLHPIRRSGKLVSFGLPDRGEPARPVGWIYLRLQPLRGGTLAPAVPRPGRGAAQQSAQLPATHERRTLHENIGVNRRSSAVPSTQQPRKSPTLPRRHSRPRLRHQRLQRVDPRRRRRVGRQEGRPFLRHHLVHAPPQIRGLRRIKPRRRHRHHA